MSKIRVIEIKVELTQDTFSNTELAADLKTNLSHASPEQLYEHGIRKILGVNVFDLKEG